MTKFGWQIILLAVAISLNYKDAKATGNKHILTVNMGTSSNVNITIPCGGKDPPYTYTRAGSSVVVENVSHFYTATKQNQFNNGEGYCCHGTGGTTCYQLNITYPPRLQIEKFTGIPPAAIYGEPYDIECPYESNPPAHYEWSRVPSCGSVKKPLSWPQHTILYNNNKKLRLDGVRPLHYGYYNCSATNAFGSRWYCLWRKVDMCSQVEYSPSDVQILHHHPNITVELHERVEINCTVRSIERKGQIEWKYNNSIINSSDDNVEINNSIYIHEMCGFVSTITIKNFTAANEGLYTCNASQKNTNYTSDSVHVVIANVAVCSQVEHSPPDVEIQNHHPNITVELHQTIRINCTVRSIEKSGTIVWKYNNSVINSSDSVQLINGNYSSELCGFVSTLVINNFTAANEGFYTCNASQRNSNYNSDSVYLLTDTVPLTDIPNQLKESSIIPLSSGLGGTVFFLVVTISISIAIILKTRKNILSQKVDTQHFTQPPADQLQFKYDVLPVYAEHDRDFVEKSFLTPLEKNGYSLLNHHLNFIPGNAIADNILIAINESRYILPIITEDFLKSKYCIYELEQSVLRMIMSKSTCIIPITLDIKFLPECLKSLVTSVILEDKYSGYSTHINRIKENIGSPMYSK